MPALNFKKVFKNKIVTGAKRSTIRAFRKDGRDPCPGQTLFLYTGMRTKSCEKLGQEICRRTRPIRIQADGVIQAGGKPMSARERLALFRVDGFDSPADFFDFFETTHGLPFEGVLIEW